MIYKILKELKKLRYDLTNPNERYIKKKQETLKLKSIRQSQDTITEDHLSKDRC